MEAGHGGSLSIQEKQSAQGQTLSQRPYVQKKKKRVGGQGEVAWEEKEINMQYTLTFLWDRVSRNTDWPQT